MRIILLRGVALYIDGFFVAILTIFSFAIHHYFLNDLTEQLENYHSFSLLSYYVISYCSYFVFCEYFFLTTIGKRILKFNIVIERADSLKLLVRIVIRTIIRFFPLNPISFLFSEKKLFWHEILSSTRTVKKN